MNQKTENENKKTHTLIISDLHLGSPVSQPVKALKLLRNYSFHRLILLGDVFESMNFNNLSKECWDFLNYVGKISKNKKVRWVIGNHDKGLTNIFGSLIDAKIYETYIWQYNQKKCIAIHGHQFDRFLINNVFLSYIASKFYNFVQRLDADEKKISHFIKRNSKGWLRLSQKVSNAAILYAEKNEADYIFCGHTHKAMQKHKRNIQYYNSGCWTDNPCTYIAIDEDKINILEY